MIKFYLNIFITLKTLVIKQIMHKNKHNFSLNIEIV